MNRLIGRFLTYRTYLLTGVQETTDAWHYAGLTVYHANDNLKGGIIAMARARRTARRTTKRRSLFDDVGDVGELGAVGHSIAQVIHIPGKGIRCKDYRGKFTKCLSGDIGDIGDVGELGATRKRRKKTGIKREYIPGVGYRCRITTGKKKGKFTKC